MILTCKQFLLTTHASELAVFDKSLELLAMH